MIPTRTPEFVVNFFHGLTTHTYLDLHHHTEHNDNAILIATKPSRFMGPQKSGFDSQGRLQIPPTRGRDFNFYLREYNSSWHTISSSSEKVVVSLQHR